MYTLGHPLKSLAGNHPVVMIPLILYSDDTSGNKSKRWNKFDSWCVKLAGLPNEENMKLDNIHHISSSNKVIHDTCKLCQLVYTNYVFYQVDLIDLADPMVKERLNWKELEC